MQWFIAANPPRAAPTAASAKSSATKEILIAASVRKDNYNVPATVTSSTSCFATRASMSLKKPPHFEKDPTFESSRQVLYHLVAQTNSHRPLYQQHHSVGNRHRPHPNFRQAKPGGKRPVLPLLKAGSANNSKKWYWQRTLPRKLTQTYSCRVSR